MTACYVDRARPHIDSADIRCPACGQTYDTIRDGFIRLPDRHYPKPTYTKTWGTIVGTEDNGHNHRDLCPATKDHLAAHLFRTQIAAQHQQRGAA